MRAMLVQSEKLASIGLLSAGVAHEINNPLAYVGNNLAVLDRDLKGLLAMMAEYESAEEVLTTVAPELVARIKSIGDDLDWPYVRQNLERMIARTRDGVQRVASIVQNLRGLARTSTPKLEPALIRDLISPAAEMIQGRGRRNRIEIDVRIPPTMRIQCVTSQVSQVVLNLLVNAMQAIESANRPEGGHIVVSAVERDDEIAISVCDDGCGIPAENVEKLFDPFFTTKVVGEGTGLGLSISHGIVTGHGGRIEVESEVGRGTTFTLVLPRRAAHTHEQGQDERPMAHRRLQSESETGKD
jgi:two-component system, NtrC family, sensor kinase